MGSARCDGPALSRKPPNFDRHVRRYRAAFLEADESRALAAALRSVHEPDERLKELPAC